MSLLGFYLILAIAKLLSFLPVHRDWIWTLQLVVSELGHWFAFLVLFLLAIQLLFFRKRKLFRLNFFLGLACAVLFLMPTFQALALQGAFRSQLQKHFPGEYWEFGLNLHELFEVQSSEIPGLKQDPYEPKETVYSADGAFTLKILDYTKEPREGKLPWVLVVHGGGWDSGTPAQLSPLSYEMAQWGFAVFAHEYRLSGKASWPAQREDIDAAITWIQKNSAILNIDPEKGFLLGRSAGGQLALSACYSGKFRLKGCIAFYAPTDMEVAHRVSSPDDFFRPIPRVEAFLGGSPQSQMTAYAESSPLRFVDEKSPPTLLIHGTPDFWVWIGHSHGLMKKLKEKSVRSFLLEIPWANHGFDVNLKGPAGQLSTQAVKWFLKNEKNR